MVGIQFNNNKLFSNKSNLIPKQYQNLINDINQLEKDLKTLSDVELRTQSFKLQNEYKETKNLNALISRSFALTREASVRTLGLRHFDVQLMGGLVLNNNKISPFISSNSKPRVCHLT